MSEMVERGAKAQFARDFCGNEDWEEQREADHMRYRELSRAALLAALDPDDEALVEAVARSIMALDLDDAFGDWTNFRLHAIGAIAACNRMAQGEREP